MMLLPDMMTMDCFLQAATLPSLATQMTLVCFLRLRVDQFNPSAWKLGLYAVIVTSL